jgi:hypothetical protein
VSAVWNKDMLIQWCLKGIPEIAATSKVDGFGDIEALNVLTSGLQSQWLRSTSASSLLPGLPNAVRQLSNAALDNHVNNYAAVKHNTPYVSLSAGVILPAPHFGGVSVRPAWQTALDFATSGGKTSGYIFRCWCIVAPKAIASLPAVADEVRDLNIFRRFWIFHDEGEIAAKLFVPSRQIECVQKVNSDLTPCNFKLPGRRGPRIDNGTFVDPHDISNLLEAVS